jgi:hypothetical protein
LVVIPINKSVSGEETATSTLKLPVFASFPSAPLSVVGATFAIRPLYSVCLSIESDLIITD